MLQEQKVSITTLASQIASHVERVLGKPVGHDEPLMEAGLDSLGAVELRTELSRIYATELSSTLIFDHPTIASLAKHLAHTLAPAPQVGLHLWLHTFPCRALSSELDLAGQQCSTYESPRHHHLLH